MTYDDEFINRMDLLNRYDSLIRQVNMKKVPFRLRGSYRELRESYEKYKQAPLEKPYLRAANPAFSKKLDEFEKLLGGKNE